MKKGFTLIELLGVIVILAIIGLITIPVVNNVLKKNVNDISADQEKLIITAAKSYVNAHAFDIPNEVTVSKLKNEGYLENTNGLDDVTVYICRTSLEGGSSVLKYKYKVNESCES